MTTDEVRAFVLNLALKFVGVPYIWGGSTPAGFDCSGFVIWVLQVFNVLPSGDWTAQGLSTRFKQIEQANLKPGDLVFYGMQSDAVTHVMMYAGEHDTLGPLVVGASGGGHTTTTIEAAALIGARVKIKPIEYRHDLIKCCTIGAPA